MSVVDEQHAGDYHVPGGDAGAQTPGRGTCASRRVILRVFSMHARPTATIYGANLPVKYNAACGQLLAPLPNDIRVSVPCLHVLQGQYAVP